LKFVAKLALKHMPEKLRQRVHFYSNFDEVKILEKEKFPVECGGEVPLKDFIGNLNYKIEPSKSSLNKFFYFRSMEANSRDK
jgi:hypothetical protein